MRLTFVSLVPAMVGAVLWGVWDAHIRTLREVAAESWMPPTHVWSCADPPTVAIEPGAAPLWAELQEQESFCGCGDREPETIFVAPRARADARRRLGITRPDEPDPAYVVSRVTRIVAGSKWFRWDLVQRTW